MRTLYNILFIIFFALSSPYYFWRMRRRGNWRRGFAERFARYTPTLKQALTNRHVLWLHAVSVGEVNLCTQLIRALEPRVPNIKFVVSTTTTTGMAELRRHLPTHISKIYYPIDRREFVNRALAVINPEAIVLVEAEIWPNFLWRAQRASNIPVFLANARLSDRSFRGYKRFGFLFRPLFASFAGVGCQNEEDAARLREVGCRPEAVHVVGNLKFDAAKLDERRTLDVPAMLRQARRAAGRANPGRRQHARRRGNHAGGNRATAAREVSEIVSGAGAAAFRALPGGGPQIARTRRQIYLSQRNFRQHATGTKAKSNVCWSTRPASCGSFTSTRQWCSSARA